MEPTRYVKLKENTSWEIGKQTQLCKSRTPQGLNTLTFFISFPKPIRKMTLLLYSFTKVIVLMLNIDMLPRGWSMTPKVIFLYFYQNHFIYIIMSLFSCLYTYHLYILIPKFWVRLTLSIFSQSFDKYVYSSLPYKLYISRRSL